MVLTTLSPTVFFPLASEPIHHDGYSHIPEAVLKTERLCAQHELYSSSFGYLLHLSIKIPANNPRIAAIGVGTALSLTELASKLPAEAELHGFETSNDYPERWSNLASNVKLHKTNIMLEFPAEFHGTFDVVTVRLLVATLTGDDWHLVTKNLAKLLKPGGSLQWQEPDVVRSVTVLEDDTRGQKRSLQTFLDEAFADKEVHDKFDYPSKHLEGVFKKAGLHSVIQEVVSSDKKLYLRYNAAILALQDLINFMKSGTSGKKLTQEELDSRLRDCMDDLESGAYQRYNFLCFIGTKA